MAYYRKEEAQKVMGKGKDLDLMVLKAPCRGCDKRQVGCHSTCEDYITYEKKNAARRDAIRNRASIADTIYYANVNRGMKLKSEGAGIKHGKSLRKGIR